MKKILTQILSMVADFSGGIFVYLFYIKGYGYGKRQSKQDKRNRGSREV